MSLDAGPAQFVERFSALLTTEGGMPRMPARVFACILVDDDGDVTAAELAERLQVSAAAISGAVRYLVQTSLVTRVRKAGERSDHVRVADDSWYETMINRGRLLTRFEQSLAEGVEAIGPGHPAAARLEETRSFFAFLRGEMPLLLERWRAERA